MRSRHQIGSEAKVPSFSGSIGVARRDITPPVGIRSAQWGLADWSAVEGVHRPLTLTAIAFGGTGAAQPLLLFAVDGTWWERVTDERQVRGTILDGLGLDEANVMFSLSHTHAGCGLCSNDLDAEGGALIPGYLSDLTSLAISAGTEARANMRPARLEWATGRCDLAAVRDLAVGSKSVVGYNPDAPADDTVLVGRMTSEAGQPLATLVNYACHPTTLAWQNRLLSPDYVGSMRELVETSTGAFCAFVQGASGDLAPREQYTGDVLVADRHGRALGHAVMSALNSLPPSGTSLVLSEIIESGAPLAVWTPQRASPSTALGACLVQAEMEIRELEDIDQLELHWQEIDPLSRRERLRRARNMREDYVTGPSVPHPIWVWKLGTSVIVGHAGEAYSHLQETVRGAFPGMPIVVMNLTNGPGFGYVPTRDAYESGAYPAWQTPLAVGSLERLEETAIATIARLNGAE